MLRRIVVLLLLFLVTTCSLYGQNSWVNPETTVLDLNMNNIENRNYWSAGFRYIKPLRGRFTVDYQWTLGRQVEGGGLYLHVPAFSVGTYWAINNLFTSDDYIGSLLISAILIPEGIGMYLGSAAENYPWHINLSFAGVDYYYRYRDKTERMWYLPGVRVQKCFLSNKNKGILFGYANVSYNALAESFTNRLSLRVGLSVQLDWDSGRSSNANDFWWLPHND